MINRFLETVTVEDPFSSETYLLRQIDSEFNPAGLEASMPDRLGGEVLLDLLCEVESVCAALGDEG